MKILILEDNFDDVYLVERTLKKAGINCTLERVDTEQEFIDAIKEKKFEVILSDHSLPQFNSLEALKLCQRSGLLVPFILVTGTVSEEFAVEVLKKGADDYVLKTNLLRLPSSIRNSLIKKNEEIARRAAELALRTQNEELVKINGELDSFVYSVSHNLSSPLKSLLGLVNISRGESKLRDPIYDQYFNMMEDSINKLDNTVKEILEYSLNARSEIIKQQIDFSELLAKALEQLKYLSGFNQLKIQTEIDQVPFYSDHHRLFVIFCNLISNAIKYMDKSKANNYLQISIQIAESSVRMLFEDNGIGIKNESLPKLFTMFFRGTELSDGAGLGLYIVKEVISKLKGSINITSSFGKGTTIEIHLPV